MSTLGLVLLIIGAAITAAHRVWFAAPDRARSRSEIDDDLRVIRRYKEYRRLKRRDPAAAEALLERMGQEREAHYRALRDRAARDPEAARAFIRLATGQLAQLRHVAGTLRRKAERDPVAALAASDLEQEIERVRNDLRCAPRPEG